MSVIISTNAVSWLLAELVAGTVGKKVLAHFVRLRSFGAHLVHKRDGGLVAFYITAYENGPLLSMKSLPNGAGEGNSFREGLKG